MKDARYLIRLANKNTHAPADAMMLLRRVRTALEGSGARAMNLRVSRSAIEFDLFYSPAQSLESLLKKIEPLGACLTAKRLDVPPPPVDPARIVQEAKTLWDEERYWEAHEVLEGLWRTLKEPEKNWVQGLILAAAAGVHLQKDEAAAAQSLSQEALRRLKGHPSTYYSLDLDAFFCRLAQLKPKN